MAIIPCTVVAIKIDLLRSAIWELAAASPNYPFQPPPPPPPHLSHLSRMLEAGPLARGVSADTMGPPPPDVELFAERSDSGGTSSLAQQAAA